MNKRIILSCLTSLVFTGQAMATEETSQYIVNGNDTTVTEYPSMASLYYDASEYGGEYSTGPYCGATILDDTHVMTAAHCVVSLSDSDNYFAVVVPQLEDEDDYLNSTYYRVKNFYYPDDYEQSSSDLYPNDIAILELEESMNVSSSDYVAYTDDESYRDADNTFIAVGHGYTSTDEDDSTVLQETDLIYVSNSTCEDVFGDALTSAQICFDGEYNSATGLKNAVCSGDSGGPVYWIDGSSQTQVGVTSFGPTTCGNPNLDVTSVFTEVSDYTDWIEDVLDGNETPQLSVTDEDREDYDFTEDTDSEFNPRLSADPDSSTTLFSSSDGGSINLFALFGGLALLGWRRRRQIKRQ